jgi:hypothetical protein
MVRLVNNFIIFLISLGELVRPLLINAKFREGSCELFFKKIIPPFRQEYFALMNGGRIASFAANVL